MPILEWITRDLTSGPVASQWADFTRIPRPKDLKHKIQSALDLYPCDILFIHRDVEGQSPSLRRDEIQDATASVVARWVPVIPVRMTEAWLFHERAIRHAAGNPNGTDDLGLPGLDRAELITDPKKLLREALLRASGLNSRRRSKLPIRERMHVIPNYIEDYGYLRELSAFQALESDLLTSVRDLT